MIKFYPNSCINCLVVLRWRPGVYIDRIWGAVLAFSSKHSQLSSRDFITDMKIFVEEMLAGRRTTLVAGSKVKQFPPHPLFFLASLLI